MRSLLLIGLAMFATPAFAQEAAQVEHAPLEITAQSVLIRHAEKSALFEGDVVLRRGAFELHCPRLFARFAEEQGKVRLVRAEAEGGVRFTDESASGRADRAQLDLAAQRIVLLGHARVQREGGLLEGERIEHDLAQHRTKAAPKEKGRVRVLIEEGQ